MTSDMAESSKPVAVSHSDSEDWADKALREVHLLVAGIEGFGKAADAATNLQELPETTGKLLLSAGIGLAMARFAPARTMFGTFARTAGANMGLSFGCEAAVHGGQVADAMTDAWRSNGNWNANVSVMQNSLGKFSFDSALMTAGGVGGAGLGSKLFRGPSVQSRIGHTSLNISESSAGRTLGVPASTHAVGEVAPFESGTYSGLGELLSSLRMTGLEAKEPFASQPIKLKLLKEPRQEVITGPELPSDGLSPTELAILYGLEEFPNNPRMASLATKASLSYAKLGIITPAEHGELAGFRSFPGNPRAAELVSKQFLQNKYYVFDQTKHLTESENAELAAFRKPGLLALREQMYSVEIQNLFKRQEGGDPNVVHVTMGEARAISAGAAEKSIFTQSLAGCYSVAVDMKLPGGAREVVLTHYPPTQTARHIERLSALTPQVPNARYGALLMVEDYADKELVDALSATLRKRLGESSPIHVERYSSARMMDTLDEGVLALTIPADSNAPVTFKTWFSAGKLATGPR